MADMRAIGIVGGLLAVVAVILKYKAEAPCTEGDQRTITCGDGTEMTQECVEGVWLPICPDEYTLTITVEE
ncbi:hypothetical protein LCGC14_3160850 [marine sediment metagenome]|uniref:Uncharacterized protein n=1 Tax=marine sediment metagenome TaxID=412755 RepID=A0A0F8VRE4_9ZZZZ